MSGEISRSSLSIQKTHSPAALTVRRCGAKSSFHPFATASRRDAEPFHETRLMAGRRRRRSVHPRAHAPWRRFPREHSARPASGCRHLRAFIKNGKGSINYGIGLRCRRAIINPSIPDARRPIVVGSGTCSMIVPEPPLDPPLKSTMERADRGRRLNIGTAQGCQLAVENVVEVSALQVGRHARLGVAGVPVINAVRCRPGREGLSPQVGSGSVEKSPDAV